LSSPSGSRRPRPTLRDVAASAGVSPKTVSRVVNGEPNVDSVTAQRVADAIATLGYRRNEVARSLRPGQSLAAVGLVIGDVSNPFYAAIARAVEGVAAAHGRLLVTASSDDDPRRERELVLAIAHRVDGLLVIPAGKEGGEGHAYLGAERQMGTPVVFLDRPPHGVDGDTILIDNVGGARRAVEHLIAHGHRRIGVVGDAPSYFTVVERVRGYREALAAAGIPVDESLVRLRPHDTEEAAAVARDLLALAGPPTAIFATNNRMSVGVLRALRDDGRSVALVGFDDFELADMLATPVTVVRHDPGELGRAAAELLFARLDGDPSPPRRVVVPTELVPRGSGEVRA
jgi:LacI family transcriptional regulator